MPQNTPNDETKTDGVRSCYSNVINFVISKHVPSTCATNHDPIEGTNCDCGAGGQNGKGIMGGVLAR